MSDTRESVEAEMAAFLSKSGHKPVTYRGLNTVLKTVFDVLIAQRAEIAALKARPPGVKWAGPWNATKRYSEGELVQKNGLFLALTDSTNAKPGQSNAWRLIVKSIEGYRE